MVMSIFHASHLAPPKIAFLGVVHGRERDLCFHFCFHAPPLPRLLLVHFWKGPSGGQALLQFWKHLQNLNSFSAAVKKRQGRHAVSHSYWPVNGTLTCRYEINFFLCYAVSYVASTCRDMRSDRSAQQSSLDQSTGPCGPSGAQCISRAVHGMQAQTICPFAT